VHLEFTDEQRLLGESAERFFADAYDLPRRRARMASADGFDRDLWAQMAELGWLALRIPERLDGLGGGPVECAVLMEAAGKALAVEPMAVSAIMASAALDLGGSEDTELATSMATGQSIVTIAQAERRSRHSLNRVETTATKKGAGFELNGTKVVVPFAGSADLFVVSARTAGGTSDTDGITLFLVTAKTNGVSVRAYPTVDGLRAGDVELDGVEVGADQVLGSVDAGHDLLRAVVDEGLLALSAESIGAMSHLNSATLEYVRTRSQFGRPIGTFQVIQHRLVDMYMALELARSMMLLAAAGMSDATADERSRLAATAKVKACEAIRLVGEDAIQLHGGMGMTDELDVSHYFKRVTMIESSYGDMDHHLGRLAAMLASAR
jgi:alkylation response protein AidB-like acyl-CoA dehydrogenase